MPVLISLVLKQFLQGQGRGGGRGRERGRGEGRGGGGGGEGKGQREGWGWRLPTLLSLREKNYQLSDSAFITLGTRGFSRVRREFSVLAEGRL